MKAYLRDENPDTFDRDFNMEVLPGVGEVIALRAGHSVRRFKVRAIEFELDNDTGDQSATIHVSEQDETDAPSSSKGPISYPKRTIV
jgi:hypothetical protein